MRYFDHDTTASRDHGINALRLEHGSVAVDLYWVIIEKIYDDEGSINLTLTNWETKSVLHLLNIEFLELQSYVKTMLEIGLLEGDLGELKSDRALANIEAYQRRAETARQNGKLGGRKTKAKTQQKPTGFQGCNQSGNQDPCKKRKEKKGVGGKNNPPNATASGAGEDKPAPHAVSLEEHVAAMQAASVPCPENVRSEIMGALKAVSA